MAAVTDKGDEACGDISLAGVPVEALVGVSESDAPHLADAVASQPVVTLDGARAPLNAGGVDKDAITADGIPCVT